MYHHLAVLNICTPGLSILELDFNLSVSRFPQLGSVSEPTLWRHRLQDLTPGWVNGQQNEDDFSLSADCLFPSGMVLQKCVVATQG